MEEIKFRVPDCQPLSRAFLDAVQKNEQTVSPVEIALPIFDWTAAVKRSIRETGWTEVGENEWGVVRRKYVRYAAAI